MASLIRASHRRRLAAPLAGIVGLALALPGAGPAAAAAGSPAASPSAWHRVSGVGTQSRVGTSRALAPARFNAVTLDRGTIAASLGAVGARQSVAGSRRVTLPTPTGGLARFDVRPSTVMEPGLARLHPDIATFSGRGVDDPAATVHLDLGPLGLHAAVRSTHGAWYVDPYFQRDQSVYVSYYGRDLRQSPHGTFVERDGAALASASAALAGQDSGLSVGPLLRTYRLALVTDPSYATYFGAANVTAAKVALINRVDQVYEDDLAIHMVLIDGTDRLNLDTDAAATGANGPCGAAPCYKPGQLDFCGIDTLYRNRLVIGQLVGASNYDIGHLALGQNGGGVAGLGVVGGYDKAVGCTGIPDPVGDFYAVDYVAHEMGHQFGGNHTFNGNQFNCAGGNRNAGTSVEPGSGSSIMAYAGICGQDDLQPHSDPYFSQRSFTEITRYVSSTGDPLSEAQTVSLRRFNGTDSFRLSYRGKVSPVVTRGVTYTPAGIKAAIKAIPGFPAGAVVAVAPFASAALAFDDTGFEVDFGGPLAGEDVAALGLSELHGAGGFVGETRRGGPIGNQGFTVTSTGNSAPRVSTASRYTIPLRTPFSLTGDATDADADTVTYLWEQNDRGGADGTALVDPAKKDGPLFRQFGRRLDSATYDPAAYGSDGENSATTDPTRTFPNLTQVLTGNTNAKTGDCPGAPAPPTTTKPVPLKLVDCYSEFLPTRAYAGLNSAGPPALHFRLTARDGHVGSGGVAHADTTLVLDRGSGPFLVTSQDRSVSYAAGSTKAITWDPAGTDRAPVGAAKVRILLSGDGGHTWPYVLAAATSNDGSQSITLPDVGTTHARIRIEALGNVFFAVNDAEFTITSGAGAATSAGVRPVAASAATLFALALGLGPDRRLRLG